MLNPQTKRQTICQHSDDGYCFLFIASLDRVAMDSDDVAATALTVYEKFLTLAPVVLLHSSPEQEGTVDFSWK